MYIRTYVCLLSYYVDNGRTLKISVWVKNLSETDVNSRYQVQRRSSLNQGKLSQFSVVQPIDLFKKEAAFNTPMYVQICFLYCIFRALYNTLFILTSMYINSYNAHV